MTLKEQAEKLEKDISKYIEKFKSVVKTMSVKEIVEKLDKCKVYADQIRKGEKPLSKANAIESFIRHGKKLGK